MCHPCRRRTQGDTDNRKNRRVKNKNNVLAGVEDKKGAHEVVRELQERHKCVPWLRGDGCAGHTQAAHTD